MEKVEISLEELRNENPDEEKLSEDLNRVFGYYMLITDKSFTIGPQNPISKEVRLKNFEYLTRGLFGTIQSIIAFEKSYDLKIFDEDAKKTITDQLESVITEIKNL